MSDLNIDVARTIATGFSRSRAEVEVTARESAGQCYREERDSIYKPAGRRHYKRVAE